MGAVAIVKWLLLYRSANRVLSRPARCIRSLRWPGLASCCGIIRWSEEPRRLHPHDYAQVSYWFIRHYYSSL